MMKKILLPFIVLCLSVNVSYAQKTVATDFLKTYLVGGKTADKEQVTQTLTKEKKAISNSTAVEKEKVIAQIRQEAEQGVVRQPLKVVDAGKVVSRLDSVKSEVMTEADIKPSRPKLVKPKRAIDFKLNDYFSKDSSRYDGIENSHLNLIYKDGGMKMVNVYDSGDTITVNIDTETGTVSIPPQQIGYNASYKSAIYIYYVDATQNKYSSTEPITGTIDENGEITLGSWGVLLAEGTYKGAIYNVFTKSVWTPSNATLTNTDTDGVSTTYPSLVEQPYDNEILIYNFAGNGKAVSASLTSAKTVKVSPQYILTNALYGKFYCYPYDIATNKADAKSSIIGTGTERTLNLGSWVVGLQNMPSTVMQKVASTFVSTSLSIKYPEALAADFDGEGTAASPYLIKTATDINALSQAVSNGEAYTGKFFRLENDIDMSGQAGSYVPVGSVDAPFNASFNGNGKTIKNLSVDQKGAYYSGLFGYIDSDAKVYDLKMVDGNIGGSGTYTGFVVGYSKGVVENCTVSGTIVSTGYAVGGIAGASENAIRNCTFNGVLKAYGCLGGIAGYNYGEVSKCGADGNITLNGYISTASSDAGGVVGELYPLKGTAAVLSDSYFVGTLADTKGLGYTGGVVGLVVSSTVERCFNVGNVYSENNNAEGGDAGSGGIVGMTSGGVFTDCYNAGAIVRGGSYSSDGAGGLAGYLSVSYMTYPETKVVNASTFTNCYNSGMVSSSSTDVNRGLYGYTFILDGRDDPAPDMFVNSYFDSQITGIKNEKYGKATSFFTSGSLPSNFSSDVWTATANQYLTLKSIGDNTAAKLSAAAILLSDNETASKVKKTFTVTAPSGISWSLYNQSTFLKETDALKMDGNTVTIKDAYSNEYVVALTENGELRVYTLAIVPKVFEGDGTESSPYLIKTKNDFILLDKAVRTYGQSHIGDFFAMENDIDFDLADDFYGVSSIGKAAFGGTFDGKGHYIHKLKIHSAGYDDNGKGTTTGSYNGAGLFNYCSAESTIKNVYIAADCDFDFWGEAGTVVGYTLGKVINCRNYAPVNCVSSYTGGVVGVVGPTATVSRCYNAGNILNGYASAGGIAGYSRGLIELSQNDGNVTADYYNAYKKAGVQSVAGGIVGTNYGDVDRNVNNGTISSYASIGGILGSSSSADGDYAVTNNVNNGIVVELATTSTRGGLIGKITGKITTVENNYYDASVNVNGGVMNAETQGITGLSSSSMTNGGLLAGLSATDFDFAASKHPVLADFKDETSAATLRCMFVKFADGERRNDVVNAVSLSENTNLAWTLKQNKEFQLSGNTLTVTPPTDMIVATDTLTASCETYIKTFYLSSIPQNLFEGKGTEENPYLLKTPDDVNKLASFMNSAKMDYDGYYFKVANDIDYAQGEYSPIAYGSVIFQGDFDGNGKTISNFVFDNEDTKAGDYIGFFGNVGSNGVVHDLTLSGKIHGYRDVGGFVSNLYGTVHNCVNKSAVSTKNTKVGGIASAAYDGSLIEKCTNEGTVTSVGSQYAGGIVAILNEGATVDSCVNKGTVSAKSTYVAGIAATCYSTITNSHNEADLTSASTTLGGIAAMVSGNVKIDSCYNTGALTGKSSVGGIFAVGNASSVATITNCYNTGAIDGTGTLGGVAGKVNNGFIIEDCYNTGSVTGTTGQNIGGFAGYLSGSADYPTYIKRCYNTGKVIGGSSKTGGFSGYLYNQTTAEDCYNTGDVEVTASKTVLGVAGFVGYLSGTATRCWNAGNVTANAAYGVAGIGGYASGTADSCFNLGNITATVVEGFTTNNGIAGGIWGFGRSKLYNCYNMGTVTAQTKVSGINGFCFSEAVIENCYNAGKIVATDADAAWANIALITESNLESSTLSNNYYDAEVNIQTDADVMTASVAKTTAEMFTTKPSEAFVTTRAAYPTLSSFADNAWANFAAASVGFTGEDNAQSVSGTFYVGKFDNVTWTASGNIALSDDGSAEPSQVGDGWVKATAQFGEQQLEKTIELKLVKATSGISTFTNGKNCINRKFYELNGVAVEKPLPGNVYIVTELYDDGSRSTQKVYYTK